MERCNDCLQHVNEQRQADKRYGVSDGREPGAICIFTFSRSIGVLVCLSETNCRWPRPMAAYEGAGAEDTSSASH